MDMAVKEAKPLEEALYFRSHQFGDLHESWSCWEKCHRVNGEQSLEWGPIEVAVVVVVPFVEIG
jgi:hypothetical protein